MKHHLLPLLTLLFFASTIYGQSPDEVKAITSQYDMAKLKEKEAYYRKLAKTEKEKAQAQAVAKGWPLFVKKMTAIY